MFHSIWRPLGEGGGVLPVMAYKGRLHPRGVGIFFAEYSKGKGNLSLGLRKGPKGLTDEFCGFVKSRQRSIVLTNSYVKDSAFTAAKRNAKFLTKYAKGVPFLSKRYAKELPFS